MIRRPTVFVLGAGASQPYGFPLGDGLVDQICAEIIDTGGPPIVARLKTLGYKPDHVHQFAHDLRGARPYSVDAFIEMRKEFRAVGKAAIADALLRAEAEHPLGTAPVQGDWYRYLFNRFLLLRNTEYFLAQARQLTVVTFNFDRSFERALFSSVRAGFGLNAELARQLVTELQIHHVHGVLGEPSWLYPSSDEATEYGPDGADLLKAVPKAIRSIKIVDDEIPEAVLEDIEAALGKAVFVYFIGFGFDERNLEKLRTPDSVRNAEAVRASVYAWSTAEQSPVRRHFGAAGERVIHLYPKVDAIGFLREHAEALFD